jgi:hypothetical protein
MHYTHHSAGSNMSPPAQIRKRKRVRTYDDIQSNSQAIGQAHAGRNEDQQKQPPVHESVVDEDEGLEEVQQEAIEEGDEQDGVADSAAQATLAEYMIKLGRYLQNYHHEHPDSTAAWQTVLTKFAKMCPNEETSEQDIEYPPEWKGRKGAPEARTAAFFTLHEAVIKAEFTAKEKAKITARIKAKARAARTRTLSHSRLVSPQPSRPSMIPPSPPSSDTTRETPQLDDTIADTASTGIRDAPSNKRTITPREPKDDGRGKHPRSETGNDDTQITKRIRRHSPERTPDSGRDTEPTVTPLGPKERESYTTASVANAVFNGIDQTLHGLSSFFGFRNPLPTQQSGNGGYRRTITETRTLEEELNFPAGVGFAAWPPRDVAVGGMDLTPFDKVADQRRRAAKQAARTHSGRLKALQRVEEDVDEDMTDASDTEPADGSGILEIEDISSEIEDKENGSDNEHDEEDDGNNDGYESE